MKKPTITPRRYWNKIITLHPVTKQGRSGHVLHCPGWLRPDGKPVLYYRSDAVPGRPHPNLVARRDQIVAQAVASMVAGSTYGLAFFLDFSTSGRPFSEVDAGATQSKP